MHGFYAARPAGAPDQERLDLFRYAPPKIPLLRLGQEPASHARLLSDQLGLNRLHVSKIVEIIGHPLPAPEFLAWVRQSLKISSMNGRLALEINRLQGYPGILSSLARDVPLLVNREFQQRGIPEHPIFVPQELEIFHTDSAAGGPLLTNQQWLLLRETIETLRHVSLRASVPASTAISKRTYQRSPKRASGEHWAHRGHESAMRLRPHPRLLLEGILLKLAFAVSWKDLPVLFDRFPKVPGRVHPHAPAFPLRAAQGLYRQLYLSGRMAAIYRQLGRHLAVYGGTTPEGLVKGGVFQLAPGRTCLSTGRTVRLAPRRCPPGYGQPLTWQKFTALLLLQRAHFNQRALRREGNLERRRQGLYLRLPPLRQPSPNLQFSSLQSPILQPPTPNLQSPTPNLQSPVPNSPTPALHPGPESLPPPTAHSPRRAFAQHPERERRACEHWAYRGSAERCCAHESAMRSPPTANRKPAPPPMIE